MMLKWLNNYRTLSFEDKTIFNTKFSIIFNLIMATSKIILSMFMGVFFLIAGIVNICLGGAKFYCYRGVRYPNRRSFIFRNRFIGGFIIVGGMQYAIYMARLIFTDVKIFNYDMLLGIIIALVSFIEIAVAIKGCLNASGKGHYYRNIKLVNMCSALTALILTMVALLQVEGKGDYRFVCGISGMIVGIGIVFIGIYVLYAPLISIVDRRHNVYRCDDKYEEDFEVLLTSSKFYASYYYKGVIKDGIIDGYIIKGKSPLFKGWNIFVIILVCILSEILIFPYLIGALVYYFRASSLVKKLDIKMKELGYEKIITKEQK